MKMHRPAALLAALLPLAAVSVAAASATPAIPYRHESNALYVIDHNGRKPVVEVELLAYSQPFVKILSRCRTNAYDLTMSMIELSAKASELGARTVTSLDMLESVARRITWKSPQRSCLYVYNLAEGHLEAGVH